MEMDLPPPDAWAVRASSLPLAFAQVREDPRLDLELAVQLPSGSRVVMIASGGDTAVCLGRLPLRLHVVDMNPAQLALAKVKWDLASRGEAARAMEILGHSPLASEIRVAELAAILNRLGLEPGILGRPELVAEFGPDHCGRYEFVFSELRSKLVPVAAELGSLLISKSPVTLSDDSDLALAMDHAFSEVMSLSNLVCLFGEAATRNPRLPFDQHFALRTREIIRSHPPISNPYLWQILAGCFHPEYRYDSLRTDGTLAATANWHLGGMDDFLDTLDSGSVDLLHLSNILDWLSPDDAAATLSRACRVLRPGGRVIIRQLNSSLSFMEIDVDLAWNRQLGVAMERRDRSYFYPGIFVGTRK